MHCRREAIGCESSRTGPIRRSSRSAGRSAPMPLPATTPRAAPPPHWSGRKAPIAAGSSGSPSAVFLARDLANTPAGDLGPEELAAAAVHVAETAGACHRVIVGDALLAENYPTIHAVGRASTRAPRLVDIVWGEPAAPKVTLVGKGVCFDTGGLDLKTASGMRLMKKDMAGCGDRARPRPGDHGRATGGAAARAAAAGRKFGVRQRDAADGHHPDPQGADRRDRQHRRRGPADPVRRAGRGRDREAGAADRHGDLDRGGAGGARPRAGGAVLQRRRARRLPCSTPPRPKPTRCGGCRCGSRTGG